MVGVYLLGCFILAAYFIQGRDLDCAPCESACEPDESDLDELR